MLDAVLNLLFPQMCVVCDLQVLERRWSVVCPDCWTKTVPVPRPICLGCGMPATSI